MPGAGPIVAVALAALVAGAARGFSGFGAALIFMPVASAALGPRVAAPLMLLVDSLAAAGMLPGAWRLADRREVGPMVGGAALGIPVGAWALTRLDPVLVRWCICVLVTAMLALLVSGWRLRQRPGAGAIAGTGVVAGFFSGVAQVSGPVVMAFWLGGTVPGPVVRANAVLFFAAGSLVTFGSYLLAALITGPVLLLTVLTVPAYAAGLFAGTRLFGRAGERAFRLACYALIAAAAFLSLPLLDGVLR